MSRFFLATPEETVRFGTVLAKQLPDAPLVVYLEGDLGAGKTTTARALLQALGVEGAVRSPTYTLIENYTTSHGDIAHLDLYRIADPEELDYLALDEIASRARLWLIEWPQKGRGALPEPDVIVTLAQQDEGRIAEFRAMTAAGKRWYEALSKAWSA